MKNTKSILMWFSKTLVLLVAITMLAAPIVTFAGDGNPQASTSITEIGNKVNTELDELKTTISATAMAVIPIALLVAVIGMCITHDSRKVAVLLKVCGTILAAAAAVTIINGNYAIDIINNLVEKFL